MSRPVMTIIAGSNGSGKNTLVAATREMFQHVPVLDREAFAKTIHETVASEDPKTESGKRVTRLTDNLISDRHSFAVVTTLSGETYLHIAEHAKHLGFNIMLIFVGTASVEVNLERVKARVKKGGDAPPEEDLRQSFPRTMANVKKLLPQTEWAVVLDNSGADGHTVVGFGTKGKMEWREPVPEWVEQLRS